MQLVVQLIKIGWHLIGISKMNTSYTNMTENKFHTPSHPETWGSICLSKDLNSNLFSFY